MTVQHKLIRQSENDFLEVFLTSFCKKITAEINFLINTYSDSDCGIDFTETLQNDCYS